MDGAGVAETRRGAHIVRRQPDGQPAAVVPHGQVTAPADDGDGPPVAILDPVGGGGSEPAVVAAGDDHISDTGLVSIGQRQLAAGRGVIKTMRSGATVEFGDQLAGGGEHDRVKSGRPIGEPCGEGILGGFGNVADMNTAVIKVEVERCRLAVAKGE
jgi:hypothetical protein